MVLVGRGHGQQLDLVAVVEGHVAGHKLVSRHGRNPDIDTAADEDIWPLGGTTDWVPPTTARTHQIVSDSTDDASGGTGARTVLIEGLDSNFDEIEETITMNGTTNVPTTKTYTMIQHMEVLTAGSGGENAGKITAIADTDSTVSNLIIAGVNHDELGVYMVPNNKTAFVLAFGGSIGKASGSGDINIVLVHKDSSVADSVYKRSTGLGLLAAGTSQTFVPQLDSHQHTERHILKARGSVGANNTEVNVVFDLLVVND